MEELEVYLSLHSEIKRAVLVLNECNIERIEMFFKYVNLDMCYIIFMRPKGEINTVIEQLKMNSLLGRYVLPKVLEFPSNYEFEGVEGDWALCPLECKGESIIPFLKYMPKYVVGSIREGNISAFGIWEKCRMFSKYINLKTVYDNKDSRVLDWKEEDNNNIELSVIFPVYNVEKYIEKCIKTVTAWKSDYVEYIFVSDGSKDSSTAIIKKWMEIDARIVLIEKENGGCASARKKGLEVARGKYVGFVDPDDFVDENMFHKLLKAAMEGNFDISLCGYNEYYENTGKIKKADDSLWYPYIEGCYDSDKINELITYCRVAIWRGIYRIEFLKNNNISFYTDLKRFDDLPFKVETFAFAKSVVIIPEYLYYYRLEREGQDVAADDDRLFVHFDIFEHLNESVGKTRIQQLIDNLQMCKIQTHRYALSKIRKEYKAEYILRAAKDLTSLDTYLRTYKVANKMLGNDVAEEYRRIVKQINK